MTKLIELLTQPSTNEVKKDSTVHIEPSSNGNADYLATLFSTVETSGDTSKEYMQLEKPTFEDMKRAGVVHKNERFEDYVTIVDGQRRIANREKYKNLTLKMYEYLQKVYGIESPEEAALYLYRPAYKKKYGNLDAIPEDSQGSFGKSSKDVMLQRYNILKREGYLK